jgi:hypothetical protein
MGPVLRSANTIKGSNTTTTTNTQLLNSFLAPASKLTAAEPQRSDLLQAPGSYTEEEQKEMLAADPDSEWNVVKANTTKEPDFRVIGC